MHTIWEVKTVQDSLDHPECVAFGPSGRFLYAGGEVGQVYRMDLGVRRCEEIARTGGSVIGVAVDGVENVYACDMRKRQVIRVHPDGATDVFCDSAAGKPLTLPNFCVFHKNGDMYLTDSGDYWHATGRLIRVRSDRTSESLLGEHLNFPNGLALSGDGSTLFMIESTSAKVSRLTLETDGTIGDPETFVTLSGTVPDGLALDQDQNLYVACYTPDLILRVDANRRITKLIEDRTSEVLNRPTNVAFRPTEDDTRLYIANLGGLHVNYLDVGVRGQVLNYPRLS